MGEPWAAGQVMVLFRAWVVLVHASPTKLWYCPMDRPWVVHVFVALVRGSLMGRP